MRQVQILKEKIQEFLTEHAFSDEKTIKSAIRKIKKIAKEENVPIKKIIHQLTPDGTLDFHVIVDRDGEPYSLSYFVRPEKPIKI